MFNIIIIEIFKLIFILALIFLFGTKKGFNKLELYWLFITLIFYTILNFLNYNQKILLIIIVLRVKSLYLPIYTFTGVFISIFSKKFETYRMLALNLYTNHLNLKINSENISNKPTIYVANYPVNYIEYLTHGLFGNKICILINNTAAKVLKYILLNFLIILMII